MLLFVLIIIIFISSSLNTNINVVGASNNFYEDVDITWGDGRAKILNRGKVVTLSLDQISGSGLQSKNQFLYGKFDMKLKLVPGNSAGVVTAYYLRSEGSTWDELDFEFLGNLSGEPYIVHTNVYSQGKGDREMQFYLWFDPTAKFHTYSILWNPSHVVLWNAEDWATRGGLVKTNWTEGPFVATLREFKVDGCVWSNGVSSCNNSSSSSKNNEWVSEELDLSSKKRLKWVQNNYMVYNYCADIKRFPQGLPSECTVTIK
ncbi:hypothetical protein F8388_008338 [Cannabis sativa]|uniref:Xyloglucan endotransglucosylase/hydrolase n=1 Tax=Cannabis sativa TaxID=3483 RepID=A0A7J6EN42_CANSA|nr:hypothetical protein F8388_008338 [Cannabis sativa]